MRIINFNKFILEYQENIDKSSKSKLVYMSSILSSDSFIQKLQCLFKFNVLKYDG